MPETRIPTEEKLAKPHKAYKVINFDLSDKTPVSKFASAPYATNSLVQFSSQVTRLKLEFQIVALP